MIALHNKPQRDDLGLVVVRQASVKFAKISCGDDCNVVCFFRSDHDIDLDLAALLVGAQIKYEVFACSSVSEARSISGVVRALIQCHRDLFIQGRNLYVAEWGGDGALAHAVSAFLLGTGVRVTGVSILARRVGNTVSSGVRLPLYVEFYSSQASWLAKSERYWTNLLSSKSLNTHLYSTNTEAEKAWMAHLISQVDSSLQSKESSRPRHLVTIQAGNNNAAQFFCVPGAGASVVDFLPFVDVLRSGSGVYAFQPPGLVDDNLPYSTVWYAAERYLIELKAALMHPECHLVGHSFGGWIAFEIACRLQMEGIRVLSLTILDSEAPCSNGRLGQDYTRLETLLQLIDLYEQSLGRPLPIARSELKALNPIAQMELLHWGLVHSGLIPPRTSMQILTRTVVAFESALHTEYAPKCIFEGVSHLILAKHHGLNSSPKESNSTLLSAWRAFAPNMLATSIDANHVTLLKHPHIDLLAPVFT